MDRIPDSLDRSKVTENLPQGMERRLVLQLMAYWRKIRENQEFPSFVDVDPFDIPDIWPHCFVIEIFRDGTEPVCRVMGDELARYVSFPLVDQSLSVVPENTLPSVALSFLDEVLDKGVPISRGDEFINHDRTKVLYRSILLPMSDDGVHISGIIGAANCREVVDGDVDRRDSA